MNIRTYKHEDLEIILHHMDDHYSKRRKDKFQLVENCEAFYCLVAEENSQIKGFIIMEELGDDISYYMVQINVAEKRKVIGTALVHTVVERAGKGAHISLCVNTDNQDAINFYESLGFKRSGFTEDYRKNQNKFWYNLELS